MGKYRKLSREAAALRDAIGGSRGLLFGNFVGFWATEIAEEHSPVEVTDEPLATGVRIQTSRRTIAELAFTSELQAELEERLLSGKAGGRALLPADHASAALTVRHFDGTTGECPRDAWTDSEIAEAEEYGLEFATRYVEWIERAAPFFLSLVEQCARLSTAVALNARERGAIEDELLSPGTLEDLRASKELREHYAACRDATRRAMEIQLAELLAVTGGRPPGATDSPATLRASTKRAQQELIAQKFASAKVRIAAEQLPGVGDLSSLLRQARSEDVSDAAAHTAVARELSVSVATVKAAVHAHLAQLDAKLRDAARQHLARVIPEINDSTYSKMMKIDEATGKEY